MLEQIDCCAKLKNRITILNSEQQIVQDQLKSVENGWYDISEVETSIQVKTANQNVAEEQMMVLSTEISRTKQLIQDLEDKMVAWETVVPETQQKIDFLNHLSGQIKAKVSEVKKIKREQASLQSKIDMLHDHEYDPDCRFCSDNEFVKQAESAKVKIIEVNKNLASQEMTLKTLEQDYSPKEIVDLKALITEFEAQTNYLKSLRQDLETKQLQQENLEGKVSLLEHQTLELIKKRDHYYENQEAFENIDSLKRDLKAMNKKTNELLSLLRRCEKKTMSLKSEEGATIQQVKEAESKLNEIKSFERDYIAYDLFIQAMHPNGVSYQVIKSMLSIINFEISKILNNIVDFEVFFDNIGDKLEIYIKHPKYDPRPLSMGSGAEKTIASMAIRLALISITNLPKSELFILDEPATALDAEHMDGFIRLLQMIKSQFKTVLLISHLESLKDIVDMTIDISKKEGYAHVKI